MKKLYIFGHRNPDTDSVCASITLANLKRKLGFSAEERVLGNLNKESKFVLNYWGVKEPKYLNDVKLQIKDLEYRKNCYMSENSSTLAVYNYMLKESTTGVPIVNEQKKLVNLITAKDILKKMININDQTLYTSYQNIIDTLDGEEIVKVDDEISGKITAASFAHSTFENTVDLGNNDILIVGDRHYIIDLAIKCRVKLIIIIGGSDIKPEHIKEAKKNGVNIIRTKLNTFETSRLIMYSNYVKKILNQGSSYYVCENDYYDDFENISNPLKIDNYPVLDKHQVCKGLLRKSEINKLHKKQVILVDHNESDQSAIGLDEAEIMEIVDHHKIGDISTKTPISFRNMPVGSSNTIIYYLYKENDIQISKEIAGLMMSAIISDTMYFKSPTSTDLDKYVVNELNKICKIDLDKYANEMFKAGTSLEGMTPRTVLNTDSKVFNSNDISIIISQAFTMDYESILKIQNEFLNEMEKIKEEEKVKHYIFIVTDIIKNGSYIMFDKDSAELVNKAWDKELKIGDFIGGVVSRKKQVVPLIMNALDK